MTAGNDRNGVDLDHLRARLALSSEARTRSIADPGHRLGPLLARVLAEYPDAILIGSFAAMAHGAAPGNADLDLLVPDQSTKQPFRTIRHEEAAIDLHPADPAFHASVLQRSDDQTVHGHALRVASLDDIIAMKKAAGRPKDLLHLMELEALKKLIDDGAERSEDR